MAAFPNTLPRFLWHFMKPYRAGFLALTATGLVWAVNETIFPYFLKLLVDGIAGFQGHSYAVLSVLKWPLLGIAIMWVVMEVCVRSKGVIELTVLPKFRADIRSSMFAVLQQHSQHFFSRRHVGSLSKKISDLPRASEAIVLIILNTFVSIFVMFVIAVVLMASVKFVFALILVGWFCAHMTIYLAFIGKCNHLAEDHAEAASLLNGKIADALANMTLVRSFARSRYEQKYLKKFQDDEIQKNRKAAWALEKVRVGLGLSGLALVFGMTASLIVGWVHGWVSLGDFTLVSMLSFGILGMVWWMSFQLSVFLREVGEAKAALALASAEREILDQPNAQPLKIQQGEIRFDNVSFTYPGSQTIFEQFSVRIAPGQKVGLVGFSGAGKSTFVSLILRFYDVTSGAIYIDGQNIAQVIQDSLHQNIAMIPQDPSLFHRSLMENIRYGRLDASDEEVMEASRLAHCHEFIAQLEHGYDTLVGERGVRLSGGQRQRVAIARAILKNAPILILDEATSSLDSVTEQLIQNSLDYLMQNRTTIIIAHRLSTLAAMDRLLVFAGGRIVEDGNHAQLLAQEGHFAKMWTMQAHGFLPEEVE